MFVPKYTISNQLLENIKKIYSLVQDLNHRRFEKVVLLEFERTAREVSTFASTSIEGNPLPLTEVMKVLKSKPGNIRNSELEVLNYNHALENLNTQVIAQKQSISLELILEIHSQVMMGLLPPFDTGKLRRKPVIVNDPRTGKVVYLPPDFVVVETLMNELVQFVKESANTIDPLILAGIFHKQMVVIHPFMDGNGRTTRLATKVLLADMGLNTFNLFSFENYYNQNVTNYFQTVGKYGDYNELKSQIDFSTWLEYFTAGIIDELLRVTKLLPTFGDTPQTKLADHTKKIIAFIKKNGFITDREYATITDRAKPTRVLDFNKLIALNLIERKGKGKATYYVMAGPS